MIARKVYLIPVIFGLWCPITFITTYVVAVLTDHVKPIFPYISDTGSWAPESCIFGMMLTIGGVLSKTNIIPKLLGHRATTCRTVVLTTYIRFRQVKDLTEKIDLGDMTKRLNVVGLYMGILATLGCLIVANFQVTNAFLVHIFGAVLCFGLGTVFQIIQVIISFRIYPSFGSKAVNIIRLIFALASFTAFGICNVTGLIAWLNYDGEDMTKWTKREKGYLPHVISAVSEYVLAFSISVFVATFAGEFKKVHLREPELVVL